MLGAGSRAVLLDFDGTLVDITLRRRESIRVAIDSLVSQTGGQPTVDEIAIRIREVIEERFLLDLDTTFEGAREMLSNFKNRTGLAIVVYSARQKEQELLAQIFRLGLAGEFDFVATTAGQKKSVDKLREKIGDLTIVAAAGDSREDFELAQDLGCPFIRVSASGDDDVEWDWGGNPARDMYALYARLLEAVL